ncbi:DUF6461 domain-containing protein [Paractinoplanes toevensis]|uniref:DUF6461 domain-containing protein n=1 Tax=Paractinoplanes toevensis TaxID=571911 RepID=UPI001BB3B68C|nr:DUF6461 domain-containing protein [Actinoplanes toevensis]
MSAAGFVTDGQDSDNADATECAFALTERLTGVPMTAALLHSATYVVTAATGSRQIWSVLIGIRCDQ